MELEHEKSAGALFEEGFNCSQSVCAAFSDEFGFEREQALRVSSAFGGGMGHNDEVCGAVSGALMVIGMKYGRVVAEDLEAKQKCYDLAREFFMEFRSLHGSIRCTDLLEYDISTEEGLEMAREKDLFNTRCVHFVSDAAKMLDRIL
jgi:C_GCAxxG_C_C family probable redox protein